MQDLKTRIQEYRVEREFHTWEPAALNSLSSPFCLFNLTHLNLVETSPCPWGVPSSNHFKDLFPLWILLFICNFARSFILPNSLGLFVGFFLLFLLCFCYLLTLLFLLLFFWYLWFIIYVSNTSVTTSWCDTANSTDYSPLPGLSTE